MGWIQDLVEGTDAARNDDGMDHAGMHRIAVIDHAHHHDADHFHPPVHHTAFDDLILQPGCSSLHEHLACPDPLTHLGDFGFPCFTYDEAHDALVDLDGDGLMDRTAWGTRVIPVEDYVRDDGTVVHGHYRTVPNASRLDNLRR